LYNIFVNKIQENVNKENIQIKLCSFLFEKENDITCENGNYDINEIFLKHQPQFHIILFIKEKLRCAKTINKKYLGLCYDRISTMDSVIIQGLVGRMNGYDTNEDSICYTNIDTILRYEELWNSRWTKMDI